MRKADAFIVPLKAFPSLYAAIVRDDRTPLSTIFFDCHEIQRGPSCLALGVELLLDWLSSEMNAGPGHRLPEEIRAACAARRPMGREVLTCFDQRDRRRLLDALDWVNNADWHAAIPQAYAKESECNGADMADACTLLAELAHSKSLDDGAVAIVLAREVPDDDLDFLVERA